MADEQVLGRGRLGRAWISAEGNLYSTLILPVAVPIGVMPQIAFVVALAVHDVVIALCPGADVKLKWPNDCLLNGGKVAGILCESVSGGGIAIGCGMNIAHSPQGLAYATAHLRQLNEDLGVETVFDAYRAALQERYELWALGRGFSEITRAWQERALGLGQPVQVKQGGTSLQGVFLGLAADGALRLQKPDGFIENVYAGDVSFAFQDSK